MRACTASVLILVAAGCSEGAIEPNATNPAHCLAITHAAMCRAERAGDYEAAVRIGSRVVFETQELHREGRYREGMEEAERLTRRIAEVRDNPEERRGMVELYSQCVERQNNSPRFRREQAQLAARARAQVRRRSAKF